MVGAWFRLVGDLGLVGLGDRPIWGLRVAPQVVEAWLGNTLDWDELGRVGALLREFVGVIGAEAEWSVVN